MLTPTERILITPAGSLPHQPTTIERLARLQADGGTIALLRRVAH